MLPASKFTIGDVVRIINHESDSQNGICVVSAVKLDYLEFNRVHLYSYECTDRQSSNGWFYEQNIKLTTVQNEDDEWWITGGSVPIRPTINCGKCNEIRVDDDFDCPYCGFEK